MQGSQDRTKWIVLAAFALLAVGVVAAILIGRGGGDDGDDSATASSAEGCEQVEAPDPKKGVSFGVPDQTVAKGETLTAVVETSCGSFEIALDAQRAPKTVNSFVFLSEEGFYDGLIFHRVAPGFVIQGGDPLGTGLGGPGYTVVERPPRDLAYTRGTVAMAKTEAEPAGASGSQFFIVTAQDAELPPEYALVGSVSGGEDVVARIASARTTPDERPVSPMVIERATLDSSG
jgi:peptidyl-prolyl cis-trans isomerase B (cyclophilin B)